jgi:hypothetical protein
MVGLVCCVIDWFGGGAGGWLKPCDHDACTDACRNASTRGGCVCVVIDWHR